MWLVTRLFLSILPQRFASLGGNSTARKKLLWKSAVEKISDKSTLLPKHLRASSTDAASMSVISGDSSRGGGGNVSSASNVNRELRLSEDFIQQINRNIVTAAHQHKYDSELRSKALTRDREVDIVAGSQC